MGRAQSFYTCKAHNLQLPERTTCPRCVETASLYDENGDVTVTSYQFEVVP